MPFVTIRMTGYGDQRWREEIDFIEWLSAAQSMHIACLRPVKRLGALGAAWIGKIGNLRVALQQTKQINKLGPVCVLP